MNNSIFRWDRDFTRSAIRLAWPSMIQSLVTALMHIVDNVMIGRLGEAELAGVTQADRVTFLMIIMLFGLVSGSSIFTSQFWGKRDLKGIHKMMGLTLMLAFGISLVFAIPSLICPEWIMSILFKGEPLAQAAGVVYLRVQAFVFIVQAISLVQETVLKSTEHVKLPMVASVIAIVTSTVSSYMLIFGRFGCPQLGVVGGAYGTLIGLVIQLMILVGVGYARKYPNAIKLRDLRLPPRDFIVQYLRTVAPVLLNETLWSSGVVMFSVAYGRMGASAVAAMSILSNVEQLASVALRGMQSACAVMIGKAIGRGDMDEAQLSAKRFTFMNIIVGIVCGLLVMLFAGNITHIFNVSDETRTAARELIFIFSMLMWLGAANGTLIVGIMRSGGDVIYSGVLDVVFLWTLAVPLVFYFGPHIGWPIAQVYLLAQTENAMKFLVGLHRVLTGKWRRNVVDELS